jgi:transcriptional regulator with XRE-family HTH domain
MPVRISRGHERDRALNENLGNRLRSLRHQAGYLLEDVQDMIGIRYDLLSRIERGESRITILELMGLAIIYEVEFKELLEGLWEYLEVSE